MQATAYDWPRATDKSYKVVCIWSLPVLYLKACGDVHTEDQGWLSPVTSQGSKTPKDLIALLAAVRLSH